jgi:NTE family protein
MTGQRKPVIGLVLGSGSARGWAHIGVIRALQQAGIQPDLVCGASIGAVVGAAYALGELDRFEQWARGLTGRTMFSFMDFKLAGGMLKGERVIEFFRNRFSDRPIEALDMPFAAVATGLHSGSEVWLRTGSTADAVRASMALPGLFTPGPARRAPAGRWRAGQPRARVAGAGHGGRHRDRRGLERRHPGPPFARARRQRRGQAARRSTAERRRNGRLAEPPAGWLCLPAARARPTRVRTPSLVEVVLASVNIMQVRITRSRMAGDPPEVMIAPQLAHLGLMDFYRAEEAIAEGQRAAEKTLPFLRQLGLGSV